MFSENLKIAALGLEMLHQMLDGSSLDIKATGNALHVDKNTMDQTSQV
jgi:hypothetical protein